MSQLPLEDQLRSMILKNGGPADASDGQFPIADNNPAHPTTLHGTRTRSHEVDVMQTGRSPSSPLQI
ncbi:hypothetical protein SLS58_006653 [Diplodia intermedia]|uniref:Uncharacterized protein n=1 Tax=Diplodia intermedia TaxID=856260 RepID=A0ABR3TMQ1_9PEZI